MDQNYHQISRLLAFIVFDPCRNIHEKLPDLCPVLKLFLQRNSQLLGQFSTDQNDFCIKMLGTQCQIWGLNGRTTTLIDFCQIAAMSENCRYKRIASFPVISTKNVILFIRLQPKYSKSCETMGRNYHKIFRSLAFLVVDSFGTIG